MSKHEKYMEECNIISKESPDTTKVGCIIVTIDDTVLRGYNGMMGLVTKERLEKPLKYKWIEHAERSVIYEAAFAGVSLYNATAYVNWFPCVDCCRAIIRSGIRTLVSPELPDFQHHKWDFKIVFQMLKEEDITVIFLDGSDFNITFKYLFNK